VPSGPDADIACLWAGEAFIDGGRIRQPTLIVRGEWDRIATHADAKRLFDSLSGSRDKREI
jgi:pimeloyl-ACP methyl ester carboxylesterase